MTFQGYLHRRAIAADVQAGRDYGGEPVFDPVPGRDEFNFIFDGMTFNLSGPQVRELKREPAHLASLFRYYEQAMAYALKEMK